MLMTLAILLCLLLYLSGLASVVFGGVG